MKFSRLYFDFDRRRQKLHCGFFCGFEFVLIEQLENIQKSCKWKGCSIYLFQIVNQFGHHGENSLCQISIWEIRFWRSRSVSSASLKYLEIRSTSVQQNEEKTWRFKTSMNAKLCRLFNKRSCRIYAAKNLSWWHGSSTKKTSLFHSNLKETAGLMSSASRKTNREDWKKRRICW